MKVQFVSLGRAAGALCGPALEPQPAIAIMPYTDRGQAERSALQLAARAGAGGLVLAVEDVERQGFVAIANRVFRETRSEFVAYVAQDCFAGRRWLARGLAALTRRGAGLLGFNDGKWSGMLAAFGLVARAWAQGNYSGELFWPEYIRHYADAELTVLAMSERRYIYDPDCVMVEVDWGKERAPVNEADRRLYRARAQAGFGGRVAKGELLKLFS